MVLPDRMALRDLPLFEHATRHSMAWSGQPIYEAYKYAQKDLVLGLQCNVGEVSTVLLHHYAISSDLR